MNSNTSGLVFGAFLTLRRKIGNVGAAEKTRTSTHVTGQRPQRCASTNSATAALEERASYQSFARL